MSHLTCLKKERKKERKKEEEEEGKAFWFSASSSEAGTLISASAVPSWPRGHQYRESLLFLRRCTIAVRRLAQLMALMNSVVCSMSSFETLQAVMCGFVVQFQVNRFHVKGLA